MRSVSCVSKCRRRLLHRSNKKHTGFPVCFFVRTAGERQREWYNGSRGTIEKGEEGSDCRPDGI